MANSNQSDITSLKMAIEALRKIRQVNYAIGNNAWNRGEKFHFAETAHTAYARYTQAIEFIQELIKRLPQLTKRLIKIKGLSKKQNAWLNLYYGSTGFEPMHLESLADGSMKFDEAAKSNIQWYEMHMRDAFHAITDDVP